MYDSWKLSAFEAMGEKLTLAKAATGRVATAAEAEASASTAVYLQASERKDVAARKFLATDEARKKAIRDGNKQLETDLNIQFQAESDLVKRLEAEEAAHLKQKELATQRPAKLREDIAKLATEDSIITELDERIRAKESEQQRNLLVKDQMLADEIISDKERLAEAKETRQKLWQSVDGCIRASDLKQEVAAEEKADAAARESWDGPQKVNYERLGQASGRKLEEATVQDAYSKALGNSLKLYEEIDTAKEEVAKATVEVNRLSRAKEAADAAVKDLNFLSSSSTEKAAKAKQAEANRQLSEAQSRQSEATQKQHFAERKVAAEKGVLPRDEARARKETADVAKATLEMDAAKLSLEKGEIAAAETGKKRGEAQARFDEGLGAELVERGTTKSRERDEAFANVRKAQDTIDLLKAVALGPDDPMEALVAAERQRATAEAAFVTAEADLKKAEKDQATAPEKDQAAIALFIAAAREDLAVRKEEHRVATEVVAQRVAVNEKLEATGALEAKGQKIEKEKEQAALAQELAQLEKATAKLDPKKEQAKIAENEERIEELKREIETAETVIKIKQSVVERATEAAVGTEKGVLNAALETAKEADGAAAAVDEEKQRKIDGDPALKKMKEDLEVKVAEELRAMAEKIMAETSVDASAKDLAVAQFQKKISESREKNQAAFAIFGGLTDQSFDQIYEKQKGNFESEIAKLATLPDPADGSKKIANPDYAKQEATARQAYVDLIEQDQILEDLGASFEDRVRAFEGVPKALWPPKFREEIKAFREVSLLVEEEKVKDEQLKKLKEEVEADLAEELGDAYKRVAPMLNLVLDSYSAYGSITGLGGSEEAPDFSTIKKQLMLMGSIGAAVGSDVASEYGAAKELSGEDEGESVKKEGEHDETLKMLEFVKTTLTAQAKMVGSVAKTAGMEIPGIEVALGAIETAEAVYAAGKAIKLAYKESTIQSEVDGGNDEIMKKAMSNQSGRAKEISVKRTVHASAKGVQLAGSAVTASGVAAAVGVGLKVGGKGLEHGNKFAFQCVDWKAAATAKATLDKAVAGSYDAMQKVFADHQMYATSYIVLRARDGDMAATKMCVGRGVDQGKLLDESVSIKLIRKLMLEVVDQQDNMETVGETVLNTFDKICKVGKMLKNVVKESELEAPTATTPPPSSSGRADLIPTQETLLGFLSSAEEISARFSVEPTSYSVADCVKRNQVVDSIVPSLRRHLEAKDPTFATRAGAPLETVKGQADRMNMLFFPLPKKPLSRAMRPAKKEFTTAEERLRRTR